ncbi:MAG TPA: hypothetical protein DEP69_02560, partial [Acidimicrobiaceae bacterium]|nr:hypothetical protein [Acidimicrobiaceae bacterium]
MPHSPAGSAADGAGEKSFADIETEIQRQSEQLRGTGKHPRQLLDRLADIYRKATPTLPEQTRSAVSEAAAPGPVAAAPTHSSELAKVLADATSAAHIDVAVPVNSRVPLGGLLKSGVRRLTSFYFQFVAYQIGLLGIRLVRALRVVADAGSAGTQVPAAPTVAQPEMPPAITQHLVEHLTGTQGRVLVLDSAGTELIDTLESAGIDTYGIAPDIT